MELQAQCHCGAVRLACEGDPVKVSLCHCRDCQRRSGSLFSVAAFFRREQFAEQGITHSFRRPSASGFAVIFHFCPACGSNIWWEPERLPHLIGVAVGAFANPHFPMPEQAVWAEDQHEWLALPHTIASHPKNPLRKG